MGVPKFPSKKSKVGPMKTVPKNPGGQKVKIKGGK